MSVFSLVLILVAIIAAVVLLFPVVFRLDFQLTESGFVADLFVFKKRLWNYTKEWKAKDEEPDVGSAGSMDSTGPSTSSPTDVEAEPAEERQGETAEKTQEEPTEKSPEESSEESSEDPVAKPVPSVEKESAPVAESGTSSPEPQKDTKDQVENVADTLCSHNDTSQPLSPAPETSTPEPEQKKSLTEREFWTLLLTPDIDERGLRYSKKILNRFVNVFHVRFRNCYVEGIRMDYKSMGYGAALNAMLKGYPFLEDWDLRMDWTRDHDLQSAGHIEATVNLCRTVWFLTVSSVYGGIFAFVFWRRRAAVLKTRNLPELGYVRTKILNWLVEE